MLQKTNKNSDQVSIKHVRALANKLPYLRISVPEVVSGEEIQWQNIIPGTYGTDQEGRFFLITKPVITMVTFKLSKGKPASIFEPVYICILQRFPEDTGFIEYTTNTLGRLFRLSIESLKEIVNALQHNKDLLVDHFV